MAQSGVDRRGGGLAIKTALAFSSFCNLCSQLGALLFWFGSQKEFGFF